MLAEEEVEEVGGWRGEERLVVFDKSFESCMLGGNACLLFLGNSLV